ncbi:hypothetical protein AYX15_07083 [Cryptococcus neoformans]|nr:hypothetical protein AYX15_07083 [Cryptococcus neoformans var. grubii]
MPVNAITNRWEFVLDTFLWDRVVWTDEKKDMVKGGNSERTRVLRAAFLVPAYAIGRRKQSH